MRIVYAALVSFTADLLLGDPGRVPHPVVFMGKSISFLEPFLRKCFPEDRKSVV